MSRYYLMSQLPSLDALSDASPLPITEERFDELCERFLGKKTLEGLNRLELIPPKDYEKSDSSFIDKWNLAERNLRLSLAKIRAEKLGKAFETNELIPIELSAVAKTAMEIDNPLAAEKFLNSYRFELLESMRPLDAFSEEAVFYYGLKLKLILRIRKFDIDAGKEAYRNIYSSILSRADLEVE